MICKNCGEKTISKGKYCHGCGQKSNTHRLTLKHFFLHDILHGLFHLDKGLLKTLKEIFIRPGGVALDYIKGKRKRYYNFFYLLLIIIGIYVFLNSFTTALQNEIKVTGNESRKILAAIRDNKKLIIFSFIPILGLSSFIIFRKLRFTILEFFIPAVIAVIGSSVFNILSNTISLAKSNFKILDPYDIIYHLESVLELSILLFPMVTFAQFIKGYYSTAGKIWRLIIFYLLSFIIVIAASLVVLSIMRGNNSITLTY